MGFGKKKRGHLKGTSASISLDFEGVGLSEDGQTLTSEGFTDSYSIHIDDHKKVEIQAIPPRFKSWRPKFDIPFEVQEGDSGKRSRFDYSWPLVGIAWLAVFIALSIVLMDRDLDKKYFRQSESKKNGLQLGSKDDSLNGNNIVSVPKVEDQGSFSRKSATRTANLGRSATNRARIVSNIRRVSGPPSNKNSEPGKIRLSLKGNFDPTRTVSGRISAKKAVNNAPRKELTRKGRSIKRQETAKRSKVARAKISKRSRARPKRRSSKTTNMTAARSQIRRVTKRSPIKIQTLPVIIE